MSSTGFVWHPGYVEHETGPGHPERPARVEAIVERLERSALWQELAQHEPQPIEMAGVRAVHDEAYLERTRLACEDAPSFLGAGDTVVSVDSWRAARLAAGGLVEACESVLARRWDNAFVCCRPPGHHAERDEAMGFCLINNVAVAARQLREVHGLERVAILDWDVHHGNGTQHIFEHDPSVLYASLHQWPLYPGTGAEHERGLGEGEGATLNCPLAPGSGDAEWLGAFEGEVLPALEAFAPDFVLVSAGFDAHARDPLAGCELTESTYARMTSALRGLADSACDGRLVLVLEGGYDLEALSASTEAAIGALR